jgi:hypothetical protein
LLPVVVLLSAFRSTRHDGGEAIRDRRADVPEPHNTEALPADSVVQRREILADVESSVLERKRETVGRFPRFGLVSRHALAPVVIARPESSRAVTEFELWR